MWAWRRNGDNRVGLLSLLWVGLLIVSACQAVPGPQAKTDERAVPPAFPSLADAMRPSPKDAMGAMHRELNVELRAPTGVASLEGSPPSLSALPPSIATQPTHSTTSSNCSGPSQPDWWTLKAPLEDIGESTASQEAGDKAARVALVKQLEVKLTGKDVSFQQETTGGVFSYSVSSEVVEQVNIGISGLDIVKRHADVCRSRYYARAKLDRTQAVHAWQIELRNLTGQRQELMRQVAEAQTRHDFLATLKGWARALELDGTAALLERRIEFLAPDQRPAEPSARRAEQDRQELDSRLGSLQLRTVSGDEQTAKPGKPLAKPLTARIVAALPGGEKSISDLPIRFTFETGQGELDPLVRTDTNGRADAVVRQVAPGASKSSVIGRVDLEQLGLDLPPVLKQELTRRFSTQVARFSITPPQAFTEGSLFGKSLHGLALELAAKVNQSQGASAVMRDFVENRTKRRMSVSSRIESSLSAGLIQNGTLQMVENVPPAVTTRSVSKEKNGPAAAVFGVYETEADGSLLITAKIIRLSDQVTEAVAEGSIPRSALTEADVRELSGLPPSSAPAPILPALAPSQSFTQWVEAFWDLRNPKGFKTELVAEQPQYQADQKASFHFRTMQDCYLNVVNIGASGAWTVLLPNAWRPTPTQTLVRASDGWVTIPDRADRFDFTVSRPFGTERIKTVCTTRPITFVQNMDVSQGLFQLSPKDGSTLRDLNVTAAVVRQEDWSEAHAEIVTLEAGQSETRGLRGLKLRGLTTK